MIAGSPGGAGAEAGVAESAPWDAGSHGGHFGHWFFLQLVRRLGLWAAYAFIYPVAFFYPLAAGRERRASQQYLERVLGPTHLLGRWLRSYRHLLEFARCHLEGAMLGTVGPDQFEIEHLGSANIRALDASGQGGVMLTAHLGTWELSSGMLKDEHGLLRVSLASIENVLRAHPYMWFNFFDFWAAVPKLPAARPGAPAPASPPREPG